MRGITPGRVPELRSVLIEGAVAWQPGSNTSPAYCLLLTACRSRSRQAAVHYWKPFAEGILPASRLPPPAALSAAPRLSCQPQAGRPGSPPHTHTTLPAPPWPQPRSRPRFLVPAPPRRSRDTGPGPAALRGSRGELMAGPPRPVRRRPPHALRPSASGRATKVRVWGTNKAVSCGFLPSDLLAAGSRNTRLLALCSVIILSRAGCSRVTARHHNTWLCSVRFCVLRGSEAWT